MSRSLGPKLGEPKLPCARPHREGLTGTTRAQASGQSHNTQDGGQDTCEVSRRTPGWVGRVASLGENLNARDHGGLWKWCGGETRKVAKGRAGLGRRTGLAWAPLCLSPLIVCLSRANTHLGCRSPCSVAHRQWAWCELQSWSPGTHDDFSTERSAPARLPPPDHSLPPEISKG